MVIKSTEWDNPGKIVRMRIHRVGPKPSLQSNKFHPMISPEYSFIRCRNTGIHGEKNTACIHSFWIRNKWKIPAEVGACETSPLMCVCAALLLQQTHNIHFFHRLKMWREGIQSNEPPSNHKWQHSLTGAWLYKRAWLTIPSVSDLQKPNDEHTHKKLSIFDCLVR